MNKSNKIFYAVAAIVSVVLLGVWLFFGYNEIHLLDLFVAVIWWAVIMGSIFLIKKLSEGSNNNDQQSPSNRM